MTNETELPADFTRCTLADLADLWNNLNQDINAIRKSRDAIAAILLDASCKDHNGADWPFRTGAIIEGEKVKLQAIWHMVDGGNRVKPKWEPRLERVRDKESKQKHKEQEE